MPEAYRQKFRNLSKSYNQTYTDFAQKKERLFEDWCRVKNVSVFAQLKELILVEDFKNNLPKEIKTHLEELKMETSRLAANTSDEYALTHKNFNRSDSWKSKSFSGERDWKSKGFQERGKPTKVESVVNSRRGGERRDLVC